MNSSKATKLIAERLAISSGCFEAPGPEDWRLAREAGFRRAELSPRRTQYEPEPYWELLKKMTEELTGAGLEVWSLHVPFGHDWNPAERDPELRISTRKRICKMMEMAAQLGAKGIVVHTCGALDEDRQGCLDAIHQTVIELVEKGERLGLFVAVENLPRECLGNCIREMREILDGTGAKICFDVNHLLLESHRDFVQQLGSRIQTVHLSDYDFVDERHWVPGRGKIQWPELMDLLNDCGYQGPILFEVSPGTPPKQMVEEFYRAITGTK